MFKRGHPTFSNILFFISSIFISFLHIKLFQNNAYRFEWVSTMYNMCIHAYKIHRSIIWLSIIVFITRRTSLSTNHCIACWLTDFIIIALIHRSIQPRVRVCRHQFIHNPAPQWPLAVKEKGRYNIAWFDAHSTYVGCTEHRAARWLGVIRRK